MAARACAKVTPGFNRAMQRIKLMPRMRRSLVMLDGSNTLLAKISASRPNHEIGKFGRTPTIVVGTAVERNNLAQHPRIGIETFAPETFCHHYDVAFCVFLRQKIASKNRMDPEQLEIVCRYITSEELGRLAHSG